MMISVTLCVGRMLQGVSSQFVVLGTLFILFRTKLSGGNLFGINMLSRDFHLSCGLLFMKLSLLKISFDPMVLFRLSFTFHVEVIKKMLITHFLIAHSLIAFGMIHAPNVSSPFIIALGLTPSVGSLTLVEGALFILF